MSNTNCRYTSDRYTVQCAPYIRHDTIRSSICGPTSCQAFCESTSPQVQTQPCEKLPSSTIKLEMTFEEIFEKVHDDQEKASLLVDSSINLCLSMKQNFHFIDKFKSFQMQSKFINLMPQEAFNFYLEEHIEFLSTNCVNMLDETKLRIWTTNAKMNLSIFVGVKFYPLLDRLISLGILEGFQMLKIFLSNVKSYPSDAASRTKLMDMIMNLLMWSNDSVVLNDFKDSPADVIFVYCKYLINKNLMLSTANQTAEHMSN
jgi:hypothetical protein